MFSLTNEEQADGWYYDDDYSWLVSWYGGYGVNVHVSETGAIGVLVNGDSHIVETNYMSHDDVYDLATALKQALIISARVLQSVYRPTTEDT